MAAAVVAAVAQAGGRALVVGGWPRDWLLQRETHDLDLEIFGLTAERVDRLLARFHPAERVPRVGRQRPVWKLDRSRLDVSLPRGDGAIPRPEATGQLETAFRESARDRDLTLNAIAWDPVAEVWIDPWHGRQDLADRRLRPVDPATFGNDPIRLLRVARFEASLGARATLELEACCRALDFTNVAVERIARELLRILAEPERPSVAFRFLERIGRLSVLPPVDALRGVPQDPRWHPEGDVFVHTLMVIDCARAIQDGLAARESERLLWSALCHDLGKPATTREQDGQIRARGHDIESARVARSWLDSLRVAGRMVRAVEALVRHHLAPAQLVGQGSTARAYRRLARRLATAGVTLTELGRLARADLLGRGVTPESSEAIDIERRFLETAREAGVASGPRPDLVTAAQLIERGLAPGPALGRALERGRAIQDEQGGNDPAAILAQLAREGLLESQNGV